MEFPGLASAFLKRVAPHAPAGLELRERPEGFVEARLDESRWEAFALDEPELDVDVDPATYDPPYPAFAVLEALDFLQEFVRDELGDAWQAGEPWAEQAGGELRFGYAGGAAFEPIRLDTLGPAS